MVSVDIKQHFNQLQPACDCVDSRFSSVHLETKTGEKKERYMVVTKVASDEELKKKEKDKQNLEIVSTDQHP